MTPCGCRIVEPETDRGSCSIEYCSLHAAAGEMLAALKDFHEGRSQSFTYSPTPTEFEERVEALIARAEGKAP